ncbi:MAG: FAD-binding oxidoreductase [archaeon]|nr:FAD-binding oxidoreductase [archaeon]
MEKVQELGKKEKFTEEVKDFISPAFITTDQYEIEAASGDLSLLPKYHYKFKEEYLASHIIRPGNTEELSKLMKKCQEYSIPVTIRAAGTSCFSSSTPTRGGVVIDVRRMNAIHKIDVENKIVKCDAGISWVKLIEELLEYGLAPKCYPTSFKSSCVSGFVASPGKAGIGVLKYGNIKDTLLSVTIVKPDGSIEKITKESKNDLSLDDITGSLGIYGAISEVEMSVTTLKTSMEMIGYSFNSMKNASDYYLTLKNNNENKPFFLSLSDKKFEKLSHKTLPSRDFFVYAVYSDEPDIVSKGISNAKDEAKKMDGLVVEDWYLKDKWDDIADTELNLARVCKNPVFQEYWVSDDRFEAFYTSYADRIKKYNYKNAFYMISGNNDRNRIKIFGLSDIANSREFFGIKANFHDITLQTYEQQDSLYAIGVVNTFYFLQYNLEDVKYITTLKNKLDPEGLVNSYRFVKAKMKFWRVNLLFRVAKFLYNAA